MNHKTGDRQADKELVSKVLRGDNTAFAVIIKNTERLVTQIVFKMIPHAEDRKDIAQDIYLKTFRKLPGFRFESKLSTWIAQVSYNTCLDHLRKKKLTLVESDEGAEESNPVWDRHTTTDEVERPVLQKALAGILQSAIDELSPIYKTLITLYHTEELSYEEIIQITGLPEGTVKNYLYRARKTLKDSLLLNYKKEEL